VSIVRASLMAAWRPRTAALRQSVIAATHFELKPPTLTDSTSSTTSSSSRSGGGGGDAIKDALTCAS